MKFNEIQFPVYRLGLEKPSEVEGVSFYHRIYGNGKEKILIVDDKTWHHETLGQRRLKVKMSGETDLFPISNAIFFLGDLIKLSTPKTWFIDTNGKIFNYTKTTMTKLLIKPISKVIPLDGGCIIELKDIQTRFKCLYKPQYEKFGGVIKYGHMYILYGLYEDQPKDTRRMI